MGDALIVVALVLLVVVGLIRDAIEKQNTLSDRQRLVQEVEQMRADGDVSGLILKLKYRDDVGSKKADGGVQVRSAAARALGDLGDPRAISPLLDALTWPTYDQIRKASISEQRDIRSFDKRPNGNWDWDFQLWPEVARALDRLGWRPEQDHAAVCYWFAKQRWDKCFEIEDHAIQAFSAMLNAGYYDSLREQAAEMLIRILLEGKPLHKGIVVSALESFAHDDYRFHTDDYGDAARYRPFDYDVTNSHTDESNRYLAEWLRKKGFDL